MEDGYRGGRIHEGRHDPNNHVCMFIPSPVRVDTLLMEVPGTPIGASFFEFELKPTGKDSADSVES